MGSEMCIRDSRVICAQSSSRYPPDGALEIRRKPTSDRSLGSNARFRIPARNRDMLWENEHLSGRSKGRTARTNANPTRYRYSNLCVRTRHRLLTSNRCFCLRQGTQAGDDNADLGGVATNDNEMNVPTSGDDSTSLDILTVRL